MAVSVVVRPDSFALVDFDAGRIERLVGELADRLGLGDGPLVVEVDERTPLGRSRVESEEPLTLRIESGAFEDRRRPRQLSDRAVIEVVGRHLLRWRDRHDPAFGAPEEEPGLGWSVAWDIHCMGRLERLGYQQQPQRWRYHYRNRCGFTDTSDAAFDELWSADHLTWAEISALVERSMVASDRAALVS